ncbi:Hypothetical predicted protein [Mytilus galloprovincialis]|uniref:Uncharacterized protein n=1 Tax=Mytilus galloprovincialis TaxID=29158 RepID=A0A8B6DPW2_MYTGA|nr:Hypothetical predicted protein [Mytilus galloprovincialis]
MDVYRKILCLYLLVVITQTVVKARSIISNRDLEKLETALETEIDDAFEVLREIKHIRNKVKRSRRHSENNGNVRTRRNYLNRKTLLVLRCQQLKANGRWPPSCRGILGNSAGDNTYIIESPDS